MKKQHGFLTKGDLLIIIAICIFAAVASLPYFLIPRPPAAKVVIASEQKVLFEYTLANIEGEFTKTFPCATGQITFAFDREKGVKVLHASCPDQLCVHAGFIKEAKQMLVCLPGRIYAEIQAAQAKGDELDAIVQ